MQKPKARDRAAASGERIRFTSNILPKWARRTKSLDALLPVLYLRGISAGDFREALAALLGKDAPNLSAAVIARLKSEWEDEYRRWQKRDLSARHYVYVWADGVYLQARMEPQAECMLVLMGATPEGKKELIGFQTGMRESGQSWKELLVDLKARGLVVAPQAAIGDGALGFWKALDEAFPTTRHQRCWLHKTLNVLDKLPKSMQPSAHKDLREIWLSPSRGAAEAAMTTFLGDLAACSADTHGSLPDTPCSAPCYSSRQSIRQHTELFGVCRPERGENRAQIANLHVFLPVTRGAASPETGFAGLRPPPGSPRKLG